jgi:hypothetical protein
LGKIKVSLTSRTLFPQIEDTPQHANSSDLLDLPSPAQEV